MVGFSLGEILGRSIDTAEERVERLRASYDAMIEAFNDIRFDDARGHLDDMRREIDSLDVFLAVSGYRPDEAEEA